MFPELENAAGVLPPSWAALLLTAIASTAYLVKEERRAGLSRSEVLRVHGTMAAAIVLGAASYGLAERGSVALQQPGLHLLRQIRHPGFLLGFLVAAPLLAQVLPARMSLASFGDVVAPGIALALAGVRVSCLLAGCCFGVESDLPWAITFPRGSLAVGVQMAAGRLPVGAAHSLPVHPLQVYFGLLALGVGVLLLWRRRHKTYDGQIVLLFLAIHETGKGLLEFLRPAALGGKHLAVVSLAFGFVGIVGLAVNGLRRRGFGA